ncbi:hypothetical protein D4768_09830 [Rhodococcus erythropolis]|uniref:hypothetical protein n=1 Tax=Rhodococcus erythropolis TaxID=1833 RepID=UPI001F4288F2|nr:hypothetical protein [Rhodococcus erythropolis]UJC77967.1 hypothetical protein D4768_09830 [Rhodococcus erythropolis]
MGTNESFEFLNELALAFRRGEKHARPQYTPILEGIRAVLAHLNSTDRLLADDEMRLTAEQVEDVRTAREELRGYRNFTGYGRHHVNQLIAAVDALFPATEPAEEVKPVQPKPNVGDWGYGGGAAVHAPEARGKTREELLSEKVEQLRDLFNGGPDTAIRTTWHDGVEYWEVPADDMRTILTSSPVVPAPTETGPWQTWQEVPEGVKYYGINGWGPTYYVNRGGVRYRVFDDTPSKTADYVVQNFAPFVAAEEG